VLRPGGRVALAAWDEVDRNPWAAIPGRLLIELGYSERPAPGTPGPFALADPDRLTALLTDAGFGEIELGAVDFDLLARGRRPALPRGARFAAQCARRRPGTSPERRGAHPAGANLGGRRRGV